MVKGFPSFFPLLVVVLIVAFGCEAGRDRAVTGNLFDRKAGKLERAAAVFDSVVNFGGSFSAPSNALAGTYGKAEAFAVFKFSTPTSSVITGLEKVRVKFIVARIWSGGERVFGLYPTVTDWSDSTQLDRDQFLGSIGLPLSTWSDTVSTVNTMTFELGSEGVDFVKNWGTTGAFLLKETADGKAMVNVYTAFSSSPPTIEFISQISGVTDTTRTNSISSAYDYDTGYRQLITSGNEGVISDGYAGGFVLYLSLPDSFPRTNMVNGGMLVLPIVRNDMPSGENMNIETLMLTAAFTILSEAKTSTTNTSDHLITSSDTKIEVDISGILNGWTITKNSNFGILFKSTTVNSSPSQIILALPDSVEMTYTTIPEMK